MFTKGPYDAARADSASWLLPVLRALLTLLFGLLLWSVAGELFSAAFRAVAGLAFRTLEFGNGGHAELVPSYPAQAVSAARDETWNVQVLLSVDGIAKTHAVTINPRRLLFLPWLLLSALFAATAMHIRAKLIGFAVGSVCLLGNALVSLWIMIAWLFARVPGLVYTLADWQLTTLHILYEGYVTPMANKLIVPLFLWVISVLLYRTFSAHSADSPSDARSSRSALAATRPGAGGRRRRDKRSSKRKRTREIARS